MKFVQVRRAFTLVELLVVVTIIGILISLLLPALSSARSAARLMQCTNNLKQVALAAHTYHDSYSSLPVGSYDCCWGTWQVSLLPYLAGQNIEGMYVGAGSYLDANRYNYGSNLPVTSRTYPALLCPEDLIGDKFAGCAKHNYVANFGNTGADATALLNGIVFRGAPFYKSGSATTAAKCVAFNEIADGLSNTLMFSETVQGRGKNSVATIGDLRGLTWYYEAASFTTYLAPNTSHPDMIGSTNWCVSGGTNPPCELAGSIPVMHAARSRHAARGVNVAMCDGSVHFTSNDIGIDVWQALSTTKGGEAFTSPF